MKLLLQAAIQNRKHFILLVFTFIAMIILTCASQLEMFALGVTAKSGTDFFTLFAPEKNGKIEKIEGLSLEQVKEKWEQIDATGTGLITRQEAQHYVAAHDDSLVQKISFFLDKHLQITNNLPRLAVLLVIVAIFKALSLFAYRYSTQLVSIRVSRDLRQKYFEHIQSLPMSFYQQHNIGSLSTRVVSDAGVVAGALNSWLINYMQTPFAAISTLIACFFISWQLSLVIFIGFPLIVIPIVYIAKRIKKISRQMQRNHEGFATVLIDFLSGIHTVKVFAMEDFSLKKYRYQNHRLAKLEERSARYGLASRPILHTIGSLFFAAVIVYGLYGVHMNIAEILVYCGLLYVFYEPIKKFAEENNQILRGVAAAERMYEVLHLKSNIEDDPNAVALEGLQDLIEFDNVSFRYNEEWILRDISFTIKKGETIAIVGPTGAGKSTIVQLLPRLYDVQAGEIRIDHKPLRAYTQRSLRENIAFVPQRPFLFLDSIKENIAFGRSFSDEEVIEAAKKAHADEFISELPDKYHSMVSEGGKNFSGGQQQRLAIARALVKKAPILIMDEATSSLDGVSESKIKDAICELHGIVTQIIIAHRFSTIEHADRIIYLEKGRKIAEGTKSELLAICPNFRLMWEIMRHDAHV